MQVSNNSSEDQKGKSPKGETRPAERQSFALIDGTKQFDPRITAYRSDLADISLAGKIFAPHYAVPTFKRCTIARTMIRSAARYDGQGVSQLLQGDAFAILEVAGDWAWGYSVHDGYVGYVFAEVLGLAEEPTHVVTSRAALIFADADFKSNVIEQIPMGAGLDCGEPSACGNYLKHQNHYVHVKHVTKCGAVDISLADLAERLLGAPYAWAGRSGDGLDCSGLIQMILGLRGIAVPRDADQQQAAVGTEIDADDVLQSGDILFFPDHVGIMADTSDIIHSNSFHMQVVKEPLADLLERFTEEVERPILARKRLGR